MASVEQNQGTPAQAPSPETVARGLSLIHGHIRTSALYALAQLGVFDALASGPKAASELAASCQADPHALARAMRVVCEDAPGIGLYAVLREADGKFENTGVASLFTRGAPNLRSYLDLMGSPFMGKAWDELGWSIRNNRPAFEKVYGMPVFAYLAQHQDAAGVFHTCLGDQSKRHADVVLGAYDGFRDLRGTVVDVGCGDGTLGFEIARTCPQLSVVQFDTPFMIDAIVAPRIQASGLGDRCSAVKGDFFDAVPPGDAILAKLVTHDWRDDQASALYRNVRKALQPGGRFLVMEHILAGDNQPHTANVFDATMLVMQDGHERFLDGYDALFAATGFERRRVVPTPLGLSIIEAVAV